MERPTGPGIDSVREAMREHDEHDEHEHDEHEPDEHEEAAPDRDEERGGDERGDDS